MRSQEEVSRFRRDAAIDRWVTAAVGLAAVVAVVVLICVALAHASDYDTCLARGTAKCGARFPSPTPSVAPTAHPTDCTDASFVYDAKAGVFSYHLTPEPGRTYRICADVAPATRVALELKTQNRSNGSCDVYEVDAHAPTNYSAALPASVQPGFPFKYVGGRWQFDVVLDSDPRTLCASAHGLTLYLWAW